MLAENARLLARSRVPIVIDHYGIYTGHTPGDGQGRALLDLLSLPHVWIKLSAPYRNSTDDLATRPDPDWLTAILAIASARCVWGSDWPHTPPHNVQMGSDLHAPYRRLPYGAVLDGFIAAVGSTELAERILSDNPARLYEFSITISRPNQRGGNQQGGFDHAAHARAVCWPVRGEPFKLPLYFQH